MAHVGRDGSTVRDAVDNLPYLQRAPYFIAIGAFYGMVWSFLTNLLGAEWVPIASIPYWLYLLVFAAGVTTHVLLIRQVEATKRAEKERAARAKGAKAQAKAAKAQAKAAKKLKATVPAESVPRPEPVVPDDSAMAPRAATPVFEHAPKPAAAPRPVATGPLVQDQAKQPWLKDRTVVLSVAGLALTAVQLIVQITQGSG